MTKRSYPFEFGVLRQFKVHVNTFECDKAALKEIEGKTLKKLFLAQKKGAVTGQNNNVEDVSCSKNKNFIQKRLSSYFTGINGNPLDKEIKGNTMNRTDSCAYCDKRSEELGICKVCFEQYCLSCSIPDYTEQNEDRRICISCS